MSAGLMTFSDDMVRRKGHHWRFWRFIFRIGVEEKSIWAGIRWLLMGTS